MHKNLKKKIFLKSFFLIFASNDSSRKIHHGGKRIGIWHSKIVEAVNIASIATNEEEMPTTVLNQWMLPSASIFMKSTLAAVSFSELEFLKSQWGLSTE
jgi:hypothetical protein